MGHVRRQWPCRKTGQGQECVGCASVYLVESFEQIDGAGAHTHTIQQISLSPWLIHAKRPGRTSPSLRRSGRPASMSQPTVAAAADACACRLDTPL
eukprot:15434427-Alexandrium_andersonii.AAC.1